MIYEYTCKKHGSFEVQKPVKDFQEKEECPICKKKCDQVFYSPHCYIVKEPTTLGHLADRNSKSMGKYELQEKSRKDRLEEVKRKYQPAIDRGFLPPDHKIPDPDAPPPFGKMDKDVKKKLFTGEKKEQKKKIRKYIEKGHL